MPDLADANRAALKAQGSYVESDIRMGQTASTKSYLGHLELLTNELDGSACFRITGETEAGEVALIVRLDDRIKLRNIAAVLSKLSVRVDLDAR